MKALLNIIVLSLIFQGVILGNNGTNTNSVSEIPVVKSDSSYGVTVQNDIEYAKGLRHASINSKDATEMSLKLDIYTPDNDVKNRPAFVFIHGGGFSGGTKQQERIIEWANYYTSRGWVFISVDYRLKRHKGSIPKLWVDYASNIPKEKAAKFLAIYPAVRDAKAALRWVVANAAIYNINTNYITVGGGSAGAITALAIGISRAEDFRDELNTEQDSTLLTTNLDQEFKVNTIVDLWGSKTALLALEEIYGHNRFDNNNPPLFIAHGTEDFKVPFSKAQELKAIYEANGVPHVFYPLKGKRHGAWGAKVKGIPLNKLAMDFMVEQQKLIIE